MRCFTAGSFVSTIGKTIRWTRLLMGVYRAYRTGEILAAQIRRTLMFDLEKVLHAMERRAEWMPYQRDTRRATGGAPSRKPPGR